MGVLNSFPLSPSSDVSPSCLYPTVSQFEVTDELRAWQMNMAAMLRRQCERGGTINPAQEVVIDDTWVIGFKCGLGQS